MDGGVPDQVSTRVQLAHFCPAVLGGEAGQTISGIGTVVVVVVLDVGVELEVVVVLEDFRPFHQRPVPTMTTRTMTRTTSFLMILFRA